MSDGNKYEVQQLAGTEVALLRRTSNGDLVHEATFKTPSSARLVARVLNESVAEAES